MKVITLALLLVFTQAAQAEQSIVCTNEDNAYVYTGFFLDKAKSFEIPANSYAVVDAIIQTANGLFVLSGQVMDGKGNKLTASNGNRRWYLLLDEWFCREVTGVEQGASKRKQPSNVPLQST